MRTLLAILVIGVLTTQSLGFFFKQNSNDELNNNNKGYWLRTLDLVQQMMTGEELFDRGLYNKLKTCMESIDPEMITVQEKIYEGMFNLWKSNGLPGDEWGHRSEFVVENKLTKASYKNMTTMQPCNSASSFAYYWAMLEVCEMRGRGEMTCMGNTTIALLDSMALIPAVSFFMHFTGTKLGGMIDAVASNTQSFVAFQGAMANLPYTPVIHELSPTPQGREASELVRKIKDMFLNEPVTQWTKSIKKFDVPSIPSTLIHTVGSMITLHTDTTAARILIPTLLTLSGRSKAETTEYVSKLLEVRSEKDIYVRNFVLNRIYASIPKVAYGYLALFPDYVTDISQMAMVGRFYNFVTNLLIPEVNRMANAQTSYTFKYKNFQKGKNLYPGEGKCNRKYPHVKWHVQSAIGFVDLVKAFELLCKGTTNSPTLVHPSIN